MKLFMVLYTFWKIGGVIGPLPYDMTECHAREHEYNHGPTPSLQLETGTFYQCQYHEIAPETDSSLSSIDNK